MKHCEKIQKPKETRDLKYTYKNKLGKTCFAHHATYYSSKDLAKRTASDRILRERAYEIPPNLMLNVTNIKED